MPKHANIRRRRNARRDEAIFRQSQCDRLTPNERLDRLDSMLGHGVGAKRERAKLIRRGIDQAQAGQFVDLGV